MTDTWSSDEWELIGDSQWGVDNPELRELADWSRRLEQRGESGVPDGEIYRREAAELTELLSRLQTGAPTDEAF